jgi:hypothetical protein
MLTEIQTDVALVANFAEDLAGHPSGAQLVKYLLIFAPAWYVYLSPSQPFSPDSGDTSMENELAYLPKVARAAT